MRERLRWRIAYLVGRLPGQCWADLVSWVYRDRRDPGWRSSIPWAPIQPSCREDAARVGACYCGELRTDNPAGPGSSVREATDG